MALVRKLQVRFLKYSGLLKIRTRVCRDFSQSLDFLDRSFLEKRKSPDFLEKKLFKKIQKLVKMLNPPVWKRVDG